MFVLQTNYINVPVAEGTILTLREANVFPRAFFFRNLTAYTITAVIQESTDGGSSWSDVGISFTIGAVGTASEVVVKLTTSSNILRVRAASGGNDRDMLIAVARVSLDANHVWTSPVL